MSVCACGCITNDGRPACDRCAALASFGLTRDAAQADIKDAYRLLAKVWHPDRFQSDEQLRRKAEEKLKEINSAYHLLATTVAENPRGPSSRPAPPAEKSQQASTATSARARYEPPGTSHFNASFRANRRTNKKRLVVTLAVLVAGGISLYLWSGRMASTQTIAKGAAKAEAIGQANREKPATAASPKLAEKQAAQTRASATSSRASVVVYPSDDPLVPYFTVGSTKADVVRVQGTPDKVSGNVFAYGLSEVFFSNGRVESWHADPSSPLKARMPQ